MYMAIIKVISRAKNSFFRYLKYKWISFHYKKYRIIKNPDAELTIIYHIKGPTWETSYAPEIFGIAKERISTASWPSENFYEIKNALVSYDSDVVLTPNGAYWSKYNEDDFVTAAKPYDRNVVLFNRDFVYIKKYNRKVFIKGKTLSLIGKYSYYWSHFLFEFVCKMYFAGEAGLLDQDINILTDGTNDSNLEEIINTYLSRYPRVHRIIIDKDVDYECEELVCMRETGSNYNEMKFTLEYRFAVPSNVTEMLHKYVSTPYIEKVKNNPVKYTKLFLSRHGRNNANGRSLRNIDEIESYFKEQGFYFVEGADLSLEEKADLFYHADIIVGLHGSAWQNVIFCKDVRCLEMSNHRYIEETLFSTMAKENTKRWMKLSGYDDNNGRNSNYYIPLDKVKVAYKMLINNKENIPL